MPLIFLLPGALSSVAYGAGPTPKEIKGGEIAPGQTPGPTVTIGENERISGSIENRPLSEILRVMSEKSLLDIRGPLPSGEPISVTFSNLTLPDALKRLMRGYNYVLMNQGAAKKPLLMVMGRVERASATEQKVPQPVSSAPPKSQAPEPGTSYVPPTTVDQPPPVARGPQPASVRGRPTGQAGSPTPAQPRSEEPPSQGQGVEKAAVPGTAEGVVPPARPENRRPEEIQRAGAQTQQQEPGQPEQAAPQQAGQTAPPPEPSNQGVRF